MRYEARRFATLKGLGCQEWRFVVNVTFDYKGWRANRLAFNDTAEISTVYNKQMSNTAQTRNGNRTVNVILCEPSIQRTVE